MSLIAGNALAQDNGSVAPSEDDPGQEQPIESASSRDQTEAGDEAATEQKADGSPYDYRSSEEISEDRSVSFPVDI